MIIQIDSREKSRAIQQIIKEFDRQGVKHIISKLFVGDYMNYDNPRLIVDRKQNLTEVCSNVCQDHERFTNEIKRANNNDIQIVFLVEHGDGITSLEDVIFWKNPRGIKRIDVNGRWTDVKTKAVTGETLYKILSTIERKYGVRFEFCSKSETGQRILEILSDDERTD
ncbi:MAG: ERCC4 domain-containing protein [Clostridia bacterium]|nr:ERCC4 domain-containing protein [Clostridia bacterium]